MGNRHIKAIESEKMLAELKHPDFPNDLSMQLAILAEEFGEVAKAICDISENNGYYFDVKDNLYEEIAQTAAVCLRMMEKFD